MPKPRPTRSATIIDRIATTLAKADANSLRSGPDHYRLLAIAALKSLLAPTESMIDAAHAAVQFDDAWAINSRADFRRAVRAMVTHAIADERGADK
jgi:hypothetical protein